MVAGGFAVAGALVSIVAGFKVSRKGGSFVWTMVSVAVGWSVVGFVLGVWK